ncbi:GM21092 [Drosophila sechellia]|uniref:GM21092 n=1 Tax=Drosophila sechellia TaxID=7238 RepID=B4HSL9_DROSE|nr:GM21092 [Drosophila sechellia]
MENESVKSEHSGRSRRSRNHTTTAEGVAAELVAAVAEEAVSTTATTESGTAPDIPTAAHTPRSRARDFNGATWHRTRPALI